MQAFVRRTTIVYPRLTCSGETMLEPKQGVRVRDATITALWDALPKDDSREVRISHVLERGGASESTFYKQIDRSKEDSVAVFLNDRHVAWMSWFENEIETKYADSGGGLEIIADVLEEGFEDQKSFALAFINIVTPCDCSNEDPCAIVGEQKEQLRRLIEQLALRMGLQHPEMTACAAVHVIDRAIVRTLATGSLTETQTARLLFQCLQHG